MEKQRKRKMATDTVVGQPAEVENGCCKKGPGYATPLDAMSGPRETLIYVTCVYTGILKLFITFLGCGGYLLSSDLGFICFFN